jgi:hypothetical protein
VSPPCQDLAQLMNPPLLLNDPKGSWRRYSPWLQDGRKSTNKRGDSRRTEGILKVPSRCLSGAAPAADQ